jgi:hypothetical protein
VPASEGLEPCFGCFWFDVAETVRERRRSTLQFSKNPLDGIPISVATHLKSEASSVERSLEVFRSIDEEFDCFDIVFLLKFAEK